MKKIHTEQTQNVTRVRPESINHQQGPSLPFLEKSWIADVLITSP